MTSLAQDQTFTNQDCSTFPATEYDTCTFTGCSFANADISGWRFVDCRFVNCDWSNASLTKTTFNDVAFSGCKMLGLRFEDCSEAPFIVSFEACTLNFSSFHGCSLKKTGFNNSVLHEVDFTEANLTAASFAGCDLHRALFENTVLEKTDFCTAVNYTINPEHNRMKRARFSREGLAGLLGKYELEIS